MTQVAVGIIQRDGLVLVCKRKKGSHYELKWEFPGGKVKDGENPVATLERELREELGLSAKIGKKVFSQLWRYPDGGEFELHFYLIKQFSGELRNEVFEEILWVKPENLGKFDFLEGSRGLVRRLQRGLGNL